MTQVKYIYEQVEQSGLYRLAGQCRDGRFEKALRPSRSRTHAQILRGLASQPVSAPVQRQPPSVPTALPRLSPWQELADMARLYLTRRAQAEPPVAPGAVWPGVPPAPETTALAVQRQREQGLRA